MDGTVFVILLLTGFCVLSTSFPNVYYFIRQEMTWDDAQAYCISMQTSMAQIFNMKNVTAMMNTPTGGYTHKAWIGLFANLSEWTSVDGQPVNYFNWGTDQPDYVNIDEICVVINFDGYWNVSNCSEMKHFVCYENGDRHYVGKERKTWNDARIFCESRGGVLANISDKNVNSKIKKSLQYNIGAWIGLSRSKSGYWSNPGEISSFLNWHNGQPDDMIWEDSCGAVMLTDGTWTDENCNTKYPFFCYGIYKAQKTVVRIKIESSANMEDPASNADVLRQLSAAVTNQGVTDFKLTWNKLPEKQTRESSEDAC